MAPDLGTFISLLGGGAGLAAIWKAVSLILDRFVPTRSDKRNDVEAAFKVLNDTIELLSKDKEKDQEYLLRKTQRITELENNDDRRYDDLLALRRERDDLRDRLAQKDELIAHLIRKIKELGADVFVDDDGHVHVVPKPPKANTGPITINEGAS